MRRQEAIDKLKVFEPRLRALGATSLFLYGSTARDEARNASDLDLFLDLDPRARFSLIDLVTAKHMVEDALDVSADVGVRDGIDPRIRYEIETDAIRVF